MSIALIVSNPQMGGAGRGRWAPQHVGRGRPDPACERVGVHVGALCTADITT